MKGDRANCRFGNGTGWLLEFVIWACGGRVMLLLACVCPCARAAEVVLQHGASQLVSGAPYQGCADAWLDESRQRNNYGGTSYLQIQYNNGYSDHALVRFELPALEFDWITNAQLGLYYYAQSSMQSDNAVAITPYRIVPGAWWYENTGDGQYGVGVNWRYRDANETVSWTGNYGAWYDKIDDLNGAMRIKRPGGTATNAIEPPNWVVWPVKNSVAQWYAGATNNGFALIESGFEGGGYIAAGQFYSKEYYYAPLRPYLRIEYAGARVRWMGFTNAFWDRTTGNWDVGGLRGWFGDGDYVVFDDSTVVTNVTVVSGGVTPALVTVSNTAVSYSFAGGGIGGPGGLIKGGLADLRLSNSNWFGGMVLIDSGRVIITTNGALGSASAGTTVSPGAALGLFGGVIYTQPEPISVSGAGPTGQGAIFADGGSNYFAGSVQLLGLSTVGVEAGSVLTLGGVVSGAHALIKLGAGQLRFGGVDPNTFSGALIVRDGTVVLDKATGPAVPGDLILAEGNPTVRLARSGQFGSGTVLHVNNPAGSATLDVNGNTDVVSGLCLTNSVLQITGGAIKLNGDVVCAGESDTEVSGVIDMMGRACQWNVILPGSATMFLPAVLVNGGVVKTGPGRLELSGMNLYDGETLVSNGVLIVASSGALGTSSGGTHVFDGAVLDLKGPVSILNEQLWLSGNGNGQGALVSSSGTNSWTGATRLTGDATLGVAPNSVLNLRNVDASGFSLTVLAGGNCNINGRILGAGTTLIKTGPGELRLSGAEANTYSGPTYVYAGTLVLGKSQGQSSIPGPVLEIGLALLESATVRCESDEQIDANCSVTVRQTGLLDLNGYSANIRTLTLVGGCVQTGTGTLSVSDAILVRGGEPQITGRLWLPTGAPIEVAQKLKLTVSGSVTGAGLAKTGAGVLILTGSNYITGAVDVNEGALVLAGAPREPGLGPGSIRVASLAVLKGTGLVTGPVTVDGMLLPGDAAPGVLMISNLVSISSGGTLVILGDDSGVSQLDLVRGGPLVLNPGARLQLAGPPPPPIRPLVIVRAATQITGEFDGLPNGAQVSEWPGWRIYYGQQRILLSPVELADPIVYFRAFATNGVVTVSWRTSAETESEGFDLFRDVGGMWIQVNAARIPAQAPEGAVYFCADPECPVGEPVRYRLVQYCSGGQEVYEFDRTPTAFELIGIDVTQPELVQIRWRSRPDEQYTVLWATNVAGPYEALLTGVPATPPTNSIVLTNSAEAAFCRIRLDP